MPTGLILWGAASSASSPHYENELRFNYPLYDIVTDRRLREGSMSAQAPSGVEDSWVTGRDFTMECEARFIPDSQSTAQTAVAGSVQWGEFLDYCRDKQPFRLVPNTCYPDFYVDNVHLVEPAQGFGQNNGALLRDVRLVMRTSGKDFTEAMRLVMFDYQPGAYINDPTSGSYSRAGIAYYHSKAGILTSVGANVLRDRHWIRQFATSSGALATTGRVTLLEVASTNLMLHPEALDSTRWEKIGVTISANAGTAPDASTRADKMLEDTSTATHRVIQQTNSIVSNTTFSGSVYLQAAERTQFRLLLDDPVTGASLVTDVNIANSCAAGSVSGTAALTMGPILESLGSSWYRVMVAGSLGTTSTSVRLLVFLRDAAGNTNYAGATSNGAFVYGAQLENLPVPTSYIASSSAVGTRSADTLVRAFSYVPQYTWFYVKALELGSRYSANYGIAQLSTANPALFFGAATTSYRIYHRSSGGVDVFSGAGGFPSYGDTVELLGLLSTSGAVQFIQSINNAADTTGAGSATQALASSWGTTNILIGNRDSGLEGIMGFKQIKVGASSTVTTMALARSA